ncbi:hypothetical protein [Luteimonas vadosa]|uniref:Tryptophan-rich sensory protein n=1 Tax=Luteimonas vadosa TaxID=1165507 RepID=A0ABP9DUP7_9GAMM
MRILLLLSAVLMPLVAWLSGTGAFGPDNGTISDRYPTLLVAAGYAFSIWGLVFLLDLAFGAWQVRAKQDSAGKLERIRPVAAAGFVLTAAWMPIFSEELFWLALLVIWASLGCLLYCAIVLARGLRANDGASPWAWIPLSLHAGWLSLAAFLNTAQVIVAYELLPTDDMLPWSAALFAAAAALLLAANWRMRGNWVFLAAVAWGLAAVYVKQSSSPLPGAHAAAWIAVGVAAVLAAQTLWLRLGRPATRGQRG